MTDKLRKGATNEEARAFLEEKQQENRARLAALPADPPAQPNGQRSSPQPKPDQKPYVAVCMSDVQPKAITWLWRDKMAYGKLSILVGDGDKGKSWAMLDLSARLSTGTPLPGEAERPERTGTVLLMGEDDAEDTIRPRLDAQGADLKYVHLWQGVPKGGTTLMVRLQRDVAACECLLRDKGARLLVIDGLASYLGGTDGINEIEVRQVLLPLAEMAQRTGVAIVAIMHRNKGVHSNPLHSIAGSMAFGNVARCVLAVCDDPDVKGRRCLVPIKGNIIQDSKGIGYRIADFRLSWDNDPVTVTKETVFAASTGTMAEPGPADEKGDRGFMRKWLVAQLAEGPMASQELKARSEAEGLLWRGVQRVTHDLGVKIESGGYPRTTTWALAPEGVSSSSRDSCDTSL